MKKFIRALLLAALTAVVCALMTGCFSTSTDELYALPAVADRYIKLQEKIDDVLDSGAEYAPPSAGYNRQPVQVADLDGDGVKEAVAFFRFTEDKPLRIYVFKNDSEEYDVAAVIEGEGTAIDSVTYTDMDGDGLQEIVVGWQMSTSLKALSLYSIKGFQPRELTTTDYSKYAVVDIDGDGKNEIAAISLPMSDQSGIAEVYSLMEDGEITSSSARMSAGISSITRVMTGNLSDGAPGIFVDSVFEESGVITDIFAYRDDALVNITMDKEQGVSSGTERANAVYCTDIDEDGVIEMPSMQLLVSQTGTNYYLINWMSYDSAGSCEKLISTYHNYSDGWYLAVPDDLTDVLSIRREDGVSGERAVVFSAVVRESTGDDPPVVDDILKIYMLQGDNRADRADIAGRFRLISDNDVIYAAEILNSGYGSLADEETIKSNFGIIYSDWITGAI